MKIVRYSLFFIAFCLLLLVVANCKKKSVEKVKFHTNYFGLTPGRFVIYSVQEMHHDVDLNPKHDTLNYQIKTVVGDEITDNEGRTVREFKRYKRLSSGLSWDFLDLWTAIITNGRAELVEENQRVIKLVFAPTLDKTWNPNAYNSLDSLKYYYTNIHTPTSISDLSFDSTLTVTKDKFSSLIDYKVDNSKYATNIGMISKTFKNLTIANFDTLDVKKGNEIHYKCTSYGFQ